MYGFRGYNPPPAPDTGTPKEPRPQANFSDEELDKIRRDYVFRHITQFSPVRRNQIIGADHILKELDTYISFLKNYAAIDGLGGELDCGVLFTGPPGSGKSFCARYLATESDARFIDVNDFPRRADAISGDDVNKLYGLCREYVRDNKKPIILFWDEFEAFAATGEDKEKIHAVGQLKQEMSGLKGKPKGVFLIVATNKSITIPGDLLRRGRIGQKIQFTALHRRAKKLMLQHYLNQYPHCDDIDYESLSFLVSYDYPADIEELVKTVWCRACIQDTKSPMLTNDYLVQQILKACRSTVVDIELTERELYAMGSYEIGRAIIARTLGMPTQLIALSRYGYMNSYRIVKYDARSEFLPFRFIHNRIAVYFGGAVAHEMCGIEPSDMFIDDIDEATREAIALAERYGNPHDDHLSIVAFANMRANENLPTSHGLAEEKLYKTGDQARQILNKGYERASAILEHYGKNTIDKMVKALIEKGHLLQMDLDSFLDKSYIAPPPPAGTFQKKKNTIGLK